MSPVQIHLFGALEVHRDGEPLGPFPTQKSRCLFAYLALHDGRHVSRDTLVGLFWGDRPDSAARKALRTCLWRVRSLLDDTGEGGGELLVTGHDTLALELPEGSSTDVLEFEEKLRLLDALGGETLTPEQADRVISAVGLYRGDLLEGVFEEWCQAERDRLRLLYLRALEQLTRFHRQEGNWSQAIARGREVLRHDPLREHVHRELIRCHHAMGDRPSALRQYETCARILREELDIEPMEETQALYRAVRAGSGSLEAATPPPPRPATGKGDGPTLDRLRERVADTLAEIDALSDEIRREEEGGDEEQESPT